MKSEADADLLPPTVFRDIRYKDNPVIDTEIADEMKSEADGAAQACPSRFQK